MRTFCFLFTFLCVQSHAAHTVCPVSAGILRGPRPGLETLFELKKMGVRTIVNLQGGDYAGNRVWGPLFIPLWEKGEKPAELAKARRDAEILEINYFNFPINSLKAIDGETARWIEQALSVMNDSEGHLVYVHCARGVDRTGLVVALYRMTYQGWSAEDAYAEMVAMGHNLLHKAFTFELDRYFFRYARALALARHQDSGAIDALDCASLLSGG